MTDKLKSTIKYILTVLGTIIGLIGLNEWVPIVEFLMNSLEDVWNAILVIVGFVTGLIGFFIGKKNEDDLDDPING